MASLDVGVEAVVGLVREGGAVVLDVDALGRDVDPGRPLRVVPVHVDLVVGVTGVQFNRYLGFREQIRNNFGDNLSTRELQV